MKKKAPDRYFLPEFLRKMLAAVYLLFIVSLSYAAADNDTKLITFAVKSENLNDVLIKFKSLKVQGLFSRKWTECMSSKKVQKKSFNR